MRVYLAVFLKYMDTKANRLNLLEFDSIQELDEFTQKFQSSNDIKALYCIDIQEFILDARKNKAYRETKTGLPITYLSAYYLENQELNFLKVNYKDKQDIILLTVDEIMTTMIWIMEKIKKWKWATKGVLTSDALLEYLEILSFFKIRLSQEELFYLKRAIVTLDERHLIKFMARIKLKLMKMERKEQYAILRFEKQKLQEFLENIWNKYDIVDDGKLENNSTISLRDRIVDDCDDETFMNLVDKENYEELFKNYELEKILRYSRDMKYPLGLRRK